MPASPVAVTEESLSADFASCASPPPAPAINVAHCVAGLANANRPFYSRPFTWDETWQSLAIWLYALRRSSIRSSAFVVLDYADYTQRPRRPVNGTTPRTILLRESFPIANVTPVRWPATSKARAVAALSLGAEHVEFANFSAGVCIRLAQQQQHYAEGGGSGNDRLNCSCGIGRATWPRFWEQMGKHAMCW